MREVAADRRENATLREIANVTSVMEFPADVQTIDCMCFLDDSSCVWIVCAQSDKFNSNSDANADTRARHRDQSVG